MIGALNGHGRLLMVSACAIFALAIAPADTVAADMSADVASGRLLYEIDFSVCHKPDGAGGVKLGTAVSADLRAPALQHMYRDDDAQLARAILDGKNENGETLAHPIHLAGAEMLF